MNREPDEQSQPATCGEGIAAHATLPAALAGLMAGMAGLLDDHQQALDLTDAAARREHQAYLTLVQELRGVAAQLEAIARRMTSYRDLPMGRHDEARMRDLAAQSAFEAFVRAERTLLDQLVDSVASHEQMLRAAR